MIWTTKSISDSLSLERLKQELETADVILIGAGAGMSTSAGLAYSGERFEKYFSDFANKYGIRDIYSGGFYPFETQEEYWAWWSRHIYYNRYDLAPGKPYTDLLELVKDKEYFVLTTNVDHQFQLAGFDKQRLFYTQGDYGLWQCSEPCHNATYDNEEQVRRMIASELIPHCSKCGASMTMNLRADDTFVQDEGWYAAASRYEEFLQKHGHKHILLLELGVGFNTPGIIKYPFWRMAVQNPKATYACINLGQAAVPKQIEKQSIAIDGDIGDVLSRLS